MSDPNKDYSKTLYFAKTNLSHLDIVLNIPGSTQPLPTVETSPRVENIRCRSLNVSQNIPTSDLKRVSANETQAKSTHGASLRH